MKLYNVCKPDSTHFACMPICVHQPLMDMANRLSPCCFITGWWLHTSNVLCIFLLLQLEQMSFDRDLVLEVFFACNKDKHLLVNYLLDHMNELDDEAQLLSNMMADGLGGA